MGRFKARCDNCKGAEQISAPLRSYLFKGGETLNINKTFAWCSECNTVVWAELLPDIESLSEVSEIEWRKNRLAPPKCLTCGSLDIIYSISSQTNSGNQKYELSCPSCDGIIRILQEPVLSLDRRWIQYTPEGDLIQNYEMSPSRGAIPKSDNT